MDEFSRRVSEGRIVEAITEAKLEDIPVMADIGAALAE